MTRRAAPAIAFAVALVATGLGVSAAAAAPRRAELHARAEREGTVRVIAALAESPRIAGRRARGLRGAERRAGIARAQGELMRELAHSGYRRARRFRRVPFVALDATPETLAALERSAHVLAIQEDRLHAPLLGQSGPLLQADLARAAGFDGAGWAVAVVDTGIDADHEFFGGRVVAEACFSALGSCPDGSTGQIGPGAGEACDYAPSCFHGTHVAGIAAGDGPDFSGVAPGASLVAIQVFSRFTGAACQGGSEDPCALAFTSDVVAALEHVADLAPSLPVAAVNLSLGSGPYTSQVLCDLENAVTRAAIDDLRAQGVATVAASGNAGLLDAIEAPGCISSAVSVGASDDADRIAGFSNSASFLSLLAPGVNIGSAVPPDLLGFSFGITSGTSMAAPHVAGAFAALRQASPAAAVPSLLAALAGTGLPITDVNEVTTPRIRVFDAALSLLGCPDADLDGVCDDVDSCSEVANSAQLDTDLDGYGNACDPDFDQSGRVTIGDFTRLRRSFNTSEGEARYDPLLDLDASGSIGIGDFNVLRGFFNLPPGPSGLVCAGSTPCAP